MSFDREPERVVGWRGNPVPREQQVVDEGEGEEGSELYCISSSVSYLFVSINRIEQAARSRRKY